MFQTLFILNPAAGHGRASGVWEAFKAAAGDYLADAACERTQGPGHAAELAFRAAEAGVSRLVAVGGDGTFSEMLEGVMRLPEGIRRATELAALPAGSGCDLARHLRYPRDLAGLLELFRSGERRGLDVGRVRCLGPDGAPRERHFVNIAAFGLAGEVARRIKMTGKKLGGTLSYALCSGHALLAARPVFFRLNADGADLSGLYHLGVLANTSYMGGGMLVAPGARDDDGALDLVLVGGMSRLKLWRNFPRLYRGTHLREPGITLRGVKVLKASADVPVYLNIDGEADGMFPAEFEVLPRAVTVLAPRWHAERGKV
ncbi:MAG: diacylglycerol kinase family lipid kinase [Elusimicrobia bacterium]|nr:diacylglycerol kinase family lipid kinase [Elusimicrobiota bacterium]